MKSHRYAELFPVRVRVGLAALLIGLTATAGSVRAQVDPPLVVQNLPSCVAVPSPATDTWPVAVTDLIGTTSGPLVFSSAALLANDVGTAPLTVTTPLSTTSTHGGTVTGSDPFTYTPAPLYVGADAFGYEVVDAMGHRAIGVVKVNVLADPGTNVPNVVGLTQSAAAAALTSASLTASATNANSTTVPIGNVISENPVAGTHVASNSTVVLTIAIGTLVPNVVGSTQAAATPVITAAGLTLGTVTAVSNAAAAGTIISQSLTVGATVAPGTALALTVSSGPAMVTVPNVVGQTQTAASSAITGAGLLVGTVTLANSTTVAAGSVISQTPVGGISVPVNSSVALTVSSGSGAAAPTIAATVFKNSAAGVTQVTSPAIVPAANTLLVAFVTADAKLAPAPNTSVTSVTNTGVALTWTRAVQANAQRGTAEIWWAFTTPAHASMTVKANFSDVIPASMTVMAFTGAAPSLAGAASLAANGASGAPTGTLVTTQGNSLVFGVGIDWDANHANLATAAGQTLVNLFAPAGNDTYWVQRTTAPAAAAGTSVTVSDSYPGAMTDRWNLALIEIRRP